MITDYATLKAAVADYLNREDLTPQIATFIQFHEAKMNRELRVPQMMVRAEATSDAEYIPVPSDFLQDYSLKLESAVPHADLTYIAQTDAKLYKAQGLTQTLYYTIVGNSFELIADPPENVDVELIYYARIPALSDSNTTNWLLTAHPDLYLYGALLESVPYLKDDERLQTWFGARQQAIDALALSGERRLRSSTQLNASIRSFG